VKIRSRSASGIAPPPNLRVRGHLPAPIINGGDSVSEWPNLRISRARDLDRDLGSGHTAYRYASLFDLYLHTKFHSNPRNFLWTDVRTGRRTFETHMLTMADFGRDPRSSDSLTRSRNNAQFHRFPVGQFSRILYTTTSIGVAM